MPLYNNILSYKKSDDTSSSGGKTTNSTQNDPSASMRLLQDHLLSKRRTKPQTTPSQKSNRSVDLPTKQLSEKILNSQDEYDPMHPNSYEVLKAEYLKSEEQRLEARKSGVTIDLNILDVLDQLEDEEHQQMDRRGTSIAPPPSLQVSSNPQSEQETGINPKIINNQQGGEKKDGSSAAAKIMSKMGYKVGQGLGKDEQGISGPLEVEKSGQNAGRIIEPQFPVKQQSVVEDCSQSTNLTSRVILLQNMVGPGEVDDDLEAETKEECKKYGDVVRCLIYEIPNKRVPDDEAVRIFIEFKRVESATKAINDLNGRYFGGRVVKATFYNVEKFNKYELGP